MLMAGLDHPCPRAARRGAGPEPRLIGGPLMEYIGAPQARRSESPRCDGGWATSLRRMSQPEPATVARTAPASGNPGGHSGANPATVLQSSWTSVPVARRRHSDPVTH
jgi:hypothetical protein